MIKLTRSTKVSLANKYDTFDADFSLNGEIVFANKSGLKCKYPRVLCEDEQGKFYKSVSKPLAGEMLSLLQPEVA